MHEEKILCVISHTHWDREWYLPFEQFRLRLVDLIDNLLRIIEAYPEFIFHLDAQTIVLKDYLEIRPDREAILRHHVSNGTIVVGPWYVQNDFYLTSGEATIRNLIYGIEMAQRFGCCARVGYTPDQFGIIGQLPQILKSFGSDSCVFGRGYSPRIFFMLGSDTNHDLPPSEFVWEGSDGTRILGIHLPYWYNNCQRISQDPAKAWRLMEAIVDSHQGLASTPFLLLMNGVDHFEAQENLLPILKQLNQDMPTGTSIRQTTLQDYVGKVQEYLKVHQLAMPVFRGELRHGNNHNLLQNTLSARIYLKTANVKLQNLIQNVLEPLYAMISLAGAGDQYDRQYFDYLWKQLLENHPHDSICGCSVDAVHRQMESRNERLFSLVEDLLARGMRAPTNPR